MSRRVGLVRVGIVIADLLFWVLLVGAIYLKTR
jgi:hypothetical protein